MNFVFIDSFHFLKKKKFNNWITNLNFFFFSRINKSREKPIHILPPTLHKGKSPRVFECKITQAEESAKTSPTWREVRHLVLETPLYPP